VLTRGLVAELHPTAVGRVLGEMVRRVHHDPPRPVANLRAHLRDLDEWNRHHDGVVTGRHLDRGRLYSSAELGHKVREAFWPPAITEQHPLAARGGMSGNGSANRP